MSEPDYLGRKEVPSEATHEIPNDIKLSQTAPFIIKNDREERRIRIASEQMAALIISNEAFEPCAVYASKAVEMADALLNETAGVYLAPIK